MGGLRWLLWGRYSVVDRDAQAEAKKRLTEALAQEARVNKLVARTEEVRKANSLAKNIGKALGAPRWTKT